VRPCGRERGGDGAHGAEREGTGAGAEGLPACEAGHQGPGTRPSGDRSPPHAPFQVRSTRTTDTTMSTVMTHADATHHWQMAWMRNSSAHVR
jgi:hypothetical protein